MCYADTETHADGTATAFCYCGWTDEPAIPADAEAAAIDHQREAEESNARIVADIIAAHG